MRVELIAKSKDIPPDMLEAVSSIVYAASRIQVSHESRIQGWCRQRAHMVLENPSV